MGVLTQLLIAVLAVISYYLITNQRYDLRITEKLNKEYDYIIVGAGSAGAVVASRLSENPNVTVLLLEAGPAGYPDADIPIVVGDLQNTEIDWKRQTEPQKYCCKSLNNGIVKWPMGKILGGTSMLNYMIYVRGSRHDFDGWEEMGCEGWGYDDVLPYFIKSENNQNQKFRRSGYHGGSGPVKVSDIRSTPLPDIFIKGCKELGEEELDVNGESQLGVMHMQGNIYNGIRQSTAEVYLRPNSHRENFHIAVNSHVTKVILEGKKAVGVEYQHEGVMKTIISRREVVVSAGAVGSPHLLMLSGIGPKKHLETHKIPVVADLPVGQNLQDHVFNIAGHFTLEAPITITENKIMSFWSWLQYAVLGTGMKATAGAEGLLFQRSEYQPSNEKYPYRQFHLFSVNPGSSVNVLLGLMKNLNSKKEIFEELYGDQIDQEGFLVDNILLHPRTQGTVTLRNSDPLEQPVVTLHYLEDSRDVDVIVEGIKFIQRLEETASFKSVGARMSRRHHPLCRNHTWGSDDYWRCYVINSVNTLYHPSSTCKMGAKEDPTAVVDPSLRVIGIDSLRVVDASIMPFVVSGNTNAACMMIGEKAADIIKKQLKMDT